MPRFRFLKALFAAVADIGTELSDSNELRLAKRLSISALFLAIFANVIWGILYTWLGQPTAGTLFFFWAAFSIITLALFALRWLGFDLYMFLSVCGLLGFSFLLTLLMGGLTSSNGHLLWGLLAPFASLVRNKQREAMAWFGVYVALVVLSIIVQPYLQSPATTLSAEVSSFFLGMNIIGASCFVIGTLSYFLAQRNLAYSLLSREQERSENLLLNILPAPIAERLKGNPRVIADAFDEVTILFADIVGFTPLSQRVPPEAMVLCLNDVYSAFDRLVEQYGLEKIRTIGDSYMVVAGAPTYRPDHAQAIAEMALDIIGVVSSLKAPNGEALHIRVGINTGPAIGAVLGANKFVYDVYGDAVNTASRMESHGLADAIQVTKDTYERLRDRYLFEERGVVQVKGRGEMSTYLLVGRKTQPTGVQSVASALLSP